MTAFQNDTIDKLQILVRLCFPTWAHVGWVVFVASVVFVHILLPFCTAAIVSMQQAHLGSYIHVAIAPPCTTASSLPASVPLLPVLALPETMSTSLLNTYTPCSPLQGCTLNDSDHCGDLSPYTGCGRW